MHKFCKPQGQPYISKKHHRAFSEVEDPARRKDTRVYPEAARSVCVILYSSLAGRAPATVARAFRPPRSVGNLNAVMINFSSIFFPCPEPSSFLLPQSNASRRFITTNLESKTARVFGSFPLISTLLEPPFTSLIIVKMAGGKFGPSNSEVGLVDCSDAIEAARRRGRWG